MSSGSSDIGSASSIIASSTSGYHILKIDGYSGTKLTRTGEFIQSRSFTLGDYPWHIQYYPNGIGPDSADYISLYLVLGRSHHVVPVMAQHRFCFADQVEAEERTTSLLKSESINPFWSEHFIGTPKFIKREDLERSGHLRNDSFTVRCDINIFRGICTEVMTPEEAAAAATSSVVSVPPSDLHRHLGDLLRTGKGADVAFEVGGRTFRAHRCVLASRSPVFSAELLGAMKESRRHDDAVRIEDMDAHVFEALLCFAYTDSLPETTTSSKEEEAAMSQHLLVAADRYGMERLMRVCEDRLCRCIEPNNVVTILSLAERHHCHGLKKACFNFIALQ